MQMKSDVLLNISVYSLNSKLNHIKIVHKTHIPFPFFDEREIRLLYGRQCNKHNL